MSWCVQGGRLRQQSWQRRSRVWRGAACLCPEPRPHWAQGSTPPSSLRFWAKLAAPSVPTCCFGRICMGRWFSGHWRQSRPVRHFPELQIWLDRAGFCRRCYMCVLNTKSVVTGVKSEWVGKSKSTDLSLPFLPLLWPLSSNQHGQDCPPPSPVCLSFRPRLVFLELCVHTSAVSTVLSLGVLRLKLPS